MAKRRARRILCGLSVLAIAFIWGNSFLSQNVSGEFSSRVEGLLLWLLRRDTLPFDVRKLAHFCEYAVLGALSCALLALSDSPNLSRAGNHVSAGLFAAVIDETIQIYAGRGPQITDVLLDFGGYACGFACVLPLWLLMALRPKRAK